MSFFKTPMYRNKKLLKLAENMEQCTRCDQYKPVCMAHSNQGRHGHSRGMKAHDIFIAALCRECHFIIDDDCKLSRAERVEEWNRAHEKTLVWLFNNGSLGVIE